MILAIEAARSIDDRRVESVGVVRRRDQNDSLVLRKAIELIQKERPVVVFDQRVEIFEHENTRSNRARALEDLTNHPWCLGAVRPAKALHVQTRLTRVIHERLDRVSLSVARRAHEKQPALPWNLELRVALAAREKPFEITDELALERFGQDQIFERCTLNGLEEIFALLPIAILKDHHLAANLGVPSFDRDQQSFGELLGLGNDPIDVVFSTRRQVARDDVFEFVPLPREVEHTHARGLYELMIERIPAGDHLRVFVR